MSRSTKSHKTTGNRSDQWKKTAFFLAWLVEFYKARSLDWSTVLPKIRLLFFLSLFIEKTNKQTNTPAKEGTGVRGENHWPAASHWQTLSHNVVSSRPAWTGFELSTLVVIGTDCIQLLYDHDGPQLYLEFQLISFIDGCLPLFIWQRFI
jgi:hypothetical protein